MVIDLGKRICTCQFWMLTGIPCIHACAALARVNKRPENFCHLLDTMESYKKTYEHHINPLPGQSLWEKSVYNQPQAPNIKRKPGKLTTKRRKDADEGTSGNKKAKPIITLKETAKAIHLYILWSKGPHQEGIADEVVAALAAATAAKSKTTPTGSTPIAAEASNAANEPPQIVEVPTGAVIQNPPHVDITDNLPPLVDAAEIDLSQPNYGGTQDEFRNFTQAPPAPTTKRPHKFSTKKRNSPPPITASVDPMQGASAAIPPLVNASVDPMQGASAATSSRLANFMKFVPTPGIAHNQTILNSTSKLQILKARLACTSSLLYAAASSKFPLSSSTIPSKHRRFPHPHRSGTRRGSAASWRPCH
ncbi:hypothetical protein Ahy_A10g050511 [Arachis hypogaea]|uniref:SWIM-type domain-containing protein n=1 Tax=Arachis hypogaea TaxID=3818 RepID=A0A445B9I8_ARAHY|nr:hypothetical protein Ahy_A10g050511 [Arachis hypogaea]